MYEIFKSRGKVVSGIVIALAGLLMIALRLLIFTAKLIVGMAHKIR